MPASRWIGPVLVCAVCVPLMANAEDVPSAAEPAKKTAQHSRHATTSPASSGATATGKASFYDRRFAGKKTASGERYDPNALTAAHRTLPLGTKVKVVNPKTDQSVVVTVNDRGPVPKGRMLDVSSAAADKLGMKKDGVTKVETEVVKPGAGEEAGSASEHGANAARSRSRVD